MKTPERGTMGKITKLGELTAQLAVELDGGIEVRLFCSPSPTKDGIPGRLVIDRVTWQEGNLHILMENGQRFTGVFTEEEAS